MPSLEDLNKKLELLERNILSAAATIVTEYAADYTAVAIHSLQKEGVDGAKYSTDPMLATASMFNKKAAFKPTVVGTTLGRDDKGKLVKGGVRTKKGNVRKSSTEDLYKWVKFPGAKKAVPVMELEEGYKELRQLNGLQISHVDLTFTGRMLQNIRVLRDEQKGFKFLAFIGASNEENKKKMEGLNKRYGNFLKIDNQVQVTLNKKAIKQFTDIVISTLKK